MRDYERLKRIVDEIPELIASNVTSSDPRFQAWKMKAKRFLESRFGNPSTELDSFEKTSFSLFFLSGTPESEYITACQKGLKKTQAIFSIYLEELNEDDPTQKGATKPLNFSKVFIVHGHDGALKHAVARIIEKQNIEAVVLSERANQGKTIIEKIEEYSNVGGAVCLFTADDLGREKDEKKEQSRARQNVVFEAGFFMGKLGRDHVALLADSGVEMPSDLSGVVYTNTANWQFELLKELNAMGYKVDMNKLL